MTTPVLKFSYKQSTSSAVSIPLLTPDEIKRYRTSSAKKEERCTLLEFSYEHTLEYLRTTPSTDAEVLEFSKKALYSDALSSAWDPFGYPFYVRADIVSGDAAALYAVRCTKRIVLLILLRPYERHSSFAEVLHRQIVPEQYKPVLYKVTGILTPERLYAAFEALSAQIIRLSTERTQHRTSPAWVHSDSPELAVLNPAASTRTPNAHNWKELYDAVGAQFDLELVLRLLQKYAPEYVSVIDKPAVTGVYTAGKEAEQFITLCTDPVNDTRYLDSVWTLYPLPRAAFIALELQVSTDGVLVPSAVATRLRLKSASPSVPRWLRRRWYVHPLKINVEHYRETHQGTVADTQHLLDALTREVAASFHALYVDEAHVTPVAFGADAELVVNADVLQLLFGEVFVAGQHASIAIIALDELIESPLPEALFASSSAATTTVPLSAALLTAFNVYSAGLAPFVETQRNAPTLVRAAPMANDAIALPSAVTMVPEETTIADATPLLVSRTVSSVHVIAIDMITPRMDTPKRVYVPPPDYYLRYAEQIREMTRLWRNWPQDEDAETLKQMCTAIVAMHNTMLELMRYIGVTRRDELTRDRETQLLKLLTRTTERDLFAQLLQPRGERMIQPLRVQTYEHVTLLTALGTELSSEGRAWLISLFGEREREQTSIHELIMVSDAKQLVNMLTLARSLAADEQRDAEERSVDAWLTKYGGGKEALKTPLEELYADVRLRYTEDKIVLQQLNSVVIELIHAKDATSYTAFVAEFGAPDSALSEHLFPEHVARRRWRWSLPMSFDDLWMVTRCEPRLIEPDAEHVSDDSLVEEPCENDALMRLANLPPSTQLGGAYANIKRQRSTDAMRWRARMRAHIALFWSDSAAKKRVGLRQFPFSDTSDAVPTAMALILHVSQVDPKVIDEDSQIKLSYTDALMLHVMRYERIEDSQIPPELSEFYSDRTILEQLQSQTRFVRANKAWSALLTDEQKARLVAHEDELTTLVDLFNKQLVNAINLYRDEILSVLVAEPITGKPAPSYRALAAIEPLDSVYSTLDELDPDQFIDSYEAEMRLVSARITAQVGRRVSPITALISDLLPARLFATLHERAFQLHKTLHASASACSVARIAMLRHVGAELPHTATDSAVHEALKPLQHKLVTLERDVVRARLHATVAHMQQHPVIVQPIGATIERAVDANRVEDRRLRSLLLSIGVVLAPELKAQPLSLEAAHTAVLAHVGKLFGENNKEKQHAALILWIMYAWWFFVDGKDEKAEEFIDELTAAFNAIRKVTDLAAFDPQYISELPVFRKLVTSTFNAIAPQERFERYTTSLYLRLFAAHYVAASTIPSNKVYDRARNAIASVLGAADLGNDRLHEFRSKLVAGDARFDATPLLTTDGILTHGRIFGPRFSELFAEYKRSSGELPDVLHALGRMAYDILQAITSTHKDLEPYVRLMKQLVETLVGMPAVPHSIGAAPATTVLEAEPLQVEKSEDALRDERTSTQQSFFRPDPREAGMLSAALNTFFCAEIDPRRDATSLARTVWHDRLAALHAEIEREPFGTGAVARGWTAVQKRAKILGRWSPADVAEAAVHLSMEQMAANGPASVATMPLALLARVLWALIGRAEFVRWLRRYGLDAHAYVDDTQHPPFRRVITVARRQAGRAYVEVDELMARELYNALLEQEKQNKDGASHRFMKLAALSYDTATNEAHDLWRLVVFGSLLDPSAMLLNGSATPGQAPIDTLDLQQQLLALLELHEQLVGAVATLSAEDKSAAQAIERQALLRAALYFTLTFLYAPEHTDNAFLLQVHPDGAVLYDSFHGDVVPYIARNVYGWPEWADTVVTTADGKRQSDARGFGTVGGRMMRSIDDQWLMRANALLQGRQLKHGAYSADEYNAAMAAGELLSRWNSLWSAMLDDAHVYAGIKPPRAILQRVLVRYPRGPLPYQFTDLKAGQAMVFVQRSSSKAGGRTVTAWLDVSPLAGLDTRSSKHRGIPEGRDGAFAHEHADFAPEPQFSYYEWRVARQYYLRPAFAADNRIPSVLAGGGGAARKHKDSLELGEYLTRGDGKEAVYKHLRLPELLLPPNAPLFFTLEWLMRNPTPSAALVAEMAGDAGQLSVEEGLGALRPVIAEAPRERSRQYERLKEELYLQNARWMEHYSAAAKVFGIDSQQSPQITETLSAALEEFAGKPRLGEQRTSALVQRIEIAERGVLEYARYAERLVSVVAPRVAADVSILADQYQVAAPTEPLASTRWLRFPSFSIE